MTATWSCFFCELACHKLESLRLIESNELLVHRSASGKRPLAGPNTTE